jgi:FKBP-type peptidyl-prolyl cis-trans isomerase 2
MANNPPSFTLLVILVAIVVIGAGVGAYFLYKYNHPPGPAAKRVVVVGDNVTVNYIGMFGSGLQQGRVFDTSIRAVADNNATYPKSLEYTPRNASSYTALGVHVGPSAPSGGYTINGVTYGTVVTGFWQGLLGLAVNQTRFISIPPVFGYGPLNPSCLRTVPLAQNVSVTVNLTPAAFTKAYPGVTPNAGVVFVDPAYGWTDTVLSANNTSVSVERLPFTGEETDAPGWPVMVTAVSGSSIALENLLTTANAGLYLGKSASTVCGTTQFTISAVNPNGTFTENFNREVVGETLVFQVTVVAFAG